MLSRLYLGSEIGQGYPGDEDNGEMSAWYLFSALGFYPLQVGSPTTRSARRCSPRRPSTWRTAATSSSRRRATSRRNIYVQGLRIDGRRHDRAYLGHRDLADGATLTFDMGPEPSDWATGPDDVLRSLTQGTQPPAPLRDVTAREGALFDDDSRTTAALSARRARTSPCLTGRSACATTR